MLTIGLMTAMGRKQTFKQMPATDQAIAGKTAIETADIADKSERRTTNRRQDGSLASWHMIVSVRSSDAAFLSRKNARVADPVLGVIDRPDLRVTEVCQNLRFA